MRSALPARAAGRLLAAATAALACVLAAVVPAPPAGADDGVTYVCERSSGYDCMPGTDYTGQSVWGSYGPGHNCVSYVAHMLQRNGSERPWEDRLGNGSDWDEHARAAGYAVDTAPAVGSIAQWDGGSGHVAYVDAVAADHIVVTEDNYSGYSSARRILRTSTTFAEAEFLHIRDLPTTATDDVLWTSATADPALWWGVPTGEASPPFRAGPAALGATSADAPVAGDLDGDGATDLVLHPPGSTRARIAWGDGRGGFSTPTTRSVPARGRARPLVGDLDGDGADDVLWYAPGPATDAVWWGEPLSRTPEVDAVALHGAYLPAVGDLDGDGVDDVVLAGPGDAVDRVVWGATGVRRIRTTRLPASGLAASATATVGDFDGDGRDDIAWSRPGPARDAIWWGEADRVPTRHSLSLDAGQVARSGDFDGDGADDLLLVGVGGTDDELLLGAVGRRSLELAAHPVTAPDGAIAVVADFGPG
ncbi:CHAP domain-containing protein [Iamia sp. SCSIO 61187]|uniref:FG-GAP-like repeat-containing protein n=1 Tax=Iamia sp. SCSIO 61187 TaxID=2722752 RepID=UPI001C638225|nr:FG-GAP-like repeat-containing protein [Iamia sp. SCSIO 61187]QYG91409.1 CHAP domain-containing protein [Iamia sp. SCSIO 61187]